MSAESAGASVAAPAIVARRSSFLSDVATIGGRALRSLTRDPESTIPPLIVGVFFFAINVGALQKLVESAGTLDFKAFQLPVAMIFSITGLSRAQGLVLDITSGYLDRLVVTPVHRVALLLGLMVADMFLAVVLTALVVAMGFIVGVDFATGAPGVIAFVAMSAAWGLAYAGFPYAIALKTGNPAAVNTSFLLFFPFGFLTTSFVPMEFLSGWLHTAATYNPVTYLLEGLRSLVTQGWDWAALGKGLAAIGGVAFVSLSLALLALRGRLARG